jgi:hypothetical protein
VFKVVAGPGALSGSQTATLHVEVLVSPQDRLIGKLCRLSDQLG